MKCQIVWMENNTVKRIEIEESKKKLLLLGYQYLFKLIMLLNNSCQLKHKWKGML
jgi:hypothetical protein